MKAHLQKEEDLNIIKQSKKTKIVEDYVGKNGPKKRIYMDCEQKNRQLTTYTKDGFVLFQQSHQKSIAIVEALEKKYRPRSQRV